ncbi:tandem-95 repeat protein, partial [Zoogloea sp.]|uniref:tandem-95 repeat protein n=1 Tax=Zoogloea sp. TaxID=49181 RepID=UPI0035B0F571
MLHTSAPQILQGSRKHELIIADGLAPEILTLIQDAKAPTLCLGEAHDALQALTTALAGETLDVLHIVAHGHIGGFEIGGNWVDQGSLLRNAHLLMHWNVRRVALWVCELGLNHEFAETLSRLTGAEVFVSKGRLGWDSDSGERHWSLQAPQRQDPLDGALVFGTQATASWNHQLVTLKLQGIYTTTASGASDTFYGEETNSVTINTTPLSSNNVTFSQAGIQFSGNNVLGTISYKNAGGTTITFDGLASRPIKVGGVVKGFYVWLDNDHNNNGSAADTAFILSLDNSYFNSTANIGSSSDRVDSSMNSVLPVNSAPAAVNDAVTLNEDNPASGNVLTNDTDANGDALTVTSFTIGGVAGTLGASNTIAGVGTFTLDASGAYSFTPLPNYNGSVPVIRYTTSDGNGGSSSASLTFTITPVNDAPTSTDASVTTLEDAGKILSLANFGSYSDAEGTPLAAVKITTLPALGTLTLNGTAVSSGQSINASDISAGKLVYTPAANGNGTAYTTLKFQVGDGALFSGDNTLTVNVTPVNDAPAGSDATLTIDEDSTKTFAASDFGFTDPTDASANALGAVLIATLPQAGSLKLNNVAVTAGQLISAADIAAGKLTYTPASNANGTSYASFTFQVQDDGGTANGGKNLDPTPNTITLNVTAVNDAPTAVNDAAQAIWSATSSYRSNPSGNVKTNDSDPDSGDTFSVVLANAGSAFNAGTASTIGSTSISPTGERTTYTVFTVGNASAAVGDAVTGNGIPAGTTVTARSSKTLTISTPAALTAGQAITVGGTGDTVATLVTSSSTVIAMDTPVGTISAGMDITGTGIPSGTKVTGVTTATGGFSLVTIDKALTATVGTDVTIGSSGATLTGTHGTLLLQSDGSYTYTVTDTGVSNGATDQFSYQVKDSSNATATATLTVTINVAAAAAPTAVADTASVTEKGGTNNGTGTGQVTGDVTPASGAGTDTTPNVAGSISVVAAAGPTDASYTTVGATDVVIHGRYGDLSIKNDGTYTYTASSSNSTVDALNSSEHLTDVFSYRITDSGGNFSTTTLTVTVNGANDAPVATDDVGWATEAGGTANGTTGQGASGNVLTNDTDVDNGSTKVVSAIRVGGTEGAGTAGSLGSGLDGSYGTLTLNTNGSYTYTVNETAANSLAAGTTVTDSFNYTVSDGSLTDTAVLSITVTGANDAPVNTVPASQTLASYETKAISGLSVTDPDGNLATSSAVALSVSHGSLSATASGAGTLSGAGTDASPLLLSGSAADVQAMLGTVIYTPTSGYSGADALRMISTDALGLTDTDVVGITVTADNRPLTVSGTAVNEASPFVFFTVGGAAGQLVSLSVSGTSATSGTDFISNLQYFDGSSWQAYSGTPVTMAGTTLLVRLPVLQDTTHEGVESLQLTASNGAGSGTTNTSSIADDGTGAIFLEGNTTGTPDTSGVGYPASLDDDRPLTVTDLTVNEASSHAVFKITGAAAQVITLALASGSATATADYASALEVWNPGTSHWDSYATSATLAADGSLFVRVAINPDDIYEGPENFGLTATNGSGIGYTGTAIIMDDGTGLKYDGTLSGGSATTTATGLDNDLSVSVSAAGPVNEGSTYAMFTVTATAGENLALSLSGSGTAPATIGGFTLQYSYDGTTWTTYSSSSQPAVPGALGSGTGVVYVRANISSEQDNTYEGTETFTLTASTSTGAGKSASAETSIVDDGSGSKYDGTLTGGVPTSSNAGLDNDVPTVSVSSVTVSEASEYAVVSVSLSHPSLSDVSFTPSSSDGSATGGTDFGTGLEYFDGTAWTPVTGSLTIAAGDTSILLRAPISHDDLYEGAETFTISTGAITGTVTNGGAASGTVTIKDDGSSTNIFLGTNQSATPTAGTADNDKPTISVAGSTVTEGDAIVFTVSLDKLSAHDISFTPVVGQIGDGATVGTDTAAATALEVSTDGGLSYNTVTGTVTIAAGESSLLLRLATVDDASAESAESLTLSTGAITGTVKNPAGASGAGSINDNDGPGISLSKATLATSESGSTDSFTVKLNSQPTADVTVTLTGLDATEGSLSATTLTFTAANWNTAQTVTVTGANDDLVDGDIAYTLTATSSSTDGNYSAKTGTVGVTNADNDSAGLVLGAISAHTTEAGGTATFTVKLSSQPTGTVTVATSSNDSTEGSVTPASLSFNASNWDTPQTVTVTGVDDPLIDGAIGYTVDLSATSGDSNYDGKTGSVNVTNDDNDSAGLTLSKATLTTSESGSTDSFTVKLNSQPTADVTVTLTGLDATEGSLSATTLTFTAANWNTAQTVTVTGANDDLVDGDIAYTLTATSSSTDGNYSAKTGTVGVTNADNDSAGL